MPAPYISELTNAGSVSSRFIEIRVDSGTDVSGLSIVFYDNNGEVKSTSSLGSIDGTGGGSDIYVITGPEQSSWDEFQAFALVDNGTVLQFVSHNGSLTGDGGPADGMTSDNLGSISGGQSLQSDDGGSTYYTQTSPNAGAVPCYAPGTLIDTPRGPRAVETLRPGDLVMTLDHGPQPILWTRSSSHPLEDAEDDAKPVQIKAGALGNNLPAQDLIVSPQHRILVGAAGQLQHVFAGEAFAPAKSLTALPGVRYMTGKTRITWIHFACDRHEVVTANGCLSESLLLGPMVSGGLKAIERRALTAILGVAPTPDASWNGPPARECLTGGAVKRQIARHLAEKRQGVAKGIPEWDHDSAMERYEAQRLREADSSAQSRQVALCVSSPR